MIETTTSCNPCVSEAAAPGRPAPTARALRPRLLVGFVLLGGLAGCGTLGGAPAGPVAAPATAPADPVVAFAASAAPGQQTGVVLAGGQPAVVKLVRVYNAASGRECREVAVTSGGVERARLVCAGPNGTWAEARPLLRGGGVARP